jgi:hypothetical protein
MWGLAPTPFLGFVRTVALADSSMDFVVAVIIRIYFLHFPFFDLTVDIGFIPLGGQP